MGIKEGQRESIRCSVRSKSEKTSEEVRGGKKGVSFTLDRAPTPVSCRPHSRGREKVVGRGETLRRGNERGNEQWRRRGWQEERRRRVRGEGKSWVAAKGDGVVLLCDGGDPWSVCKLL